MSLTFNTRQARWYWATAALTGLCAVTLILMGRELICTCGYVKLWHGETVSAENSQHLTDWYTPSHIIHGIIFYAALVLVLPRTGLGFRLFLATLIEVAWEILENTDRVINHYRTVTISIGYYGDSVVNTTSDVLFMMLGFWLARVIPVWASIGLILFFEILTAIIIRDGLTLNVIMLLFPIDALLEWQNAARQINP